MVRTVLFYAIAAGENWNGFPATAPNRRVLIYQGDESKHDMLQALNKRGFKPGTEVRKCTQARFGWNTDAIPILYKDIEEYDPAVIMIDSLTFVNRYSIYDENSVEYSRAVLEINEIASRTGKTIIIIHHSNRAGKARGSTAIFNAVSEVLKLEKDTSAGANPQEKILTIEKSRSRRFPCQYKLFFNEEDFSLSLIEEVGKLRQLGGTMLEPEYIWVENCKLLRLPNPPELNQHMFQSPDAEIFAVYEDSFEIEH
ncbi:MAG: AAA family ATPase [Tolypothrix brevis GSE-NOS-MK-07-07A]|jgi:replicative DNA helicase|nr:AAA family ATPase [Tolypothrix brevis GSE-NOS-MK-07-07A]